MLYLTSCIFDGCIKGNISGVSVMVSNGWVSVVAARYERMVPARCEFLYGTFCSERRSTFDRERKCFPLAFLCHSVFENGAKIRFLSFVFRAECRRDRFGSGHGDAYGSACPDGLCRRTQESRKRIRQHWFRYRKSRNGNYCAYL